MAILTPKQLKEIKAQRDQELQARIEQADVRATNQTSNQTSTTIDEVLEEFKDYYPANAGSILHTLFNQRRCPRCNAMLQPTLSISGAPSTDWLECSNNVCNTYVDMYHPMAHQASVHLDPHRIIGNFGSYGTGN